MPRSPNKASDLNKWAKLSLITAAFDLHCFTSVWMYEVPAEQSSFGWRQRMRSSENGHRCVRQWMPGVYGAVCLQRVLTQQVSASGNHLHISAWSTPIPPSPTWSYSHLGCLLLSVACCVFNRIMPGKCNRSTHWSLAEQEQRCATAKERTWWNEMLW